MEKYFSYPWAFPFGLYFYVLFQIMYAMRFGNINTNYSILDLFIWAVGIGSVLMLMYFMRKLEHKRTLMLIPFAIALPLSYVAALGGGLLGTLGVLFFGLVPFAAILALGYWLINKFTTTTEVESSPSL